MSGTGWRTFYATQYEGETAPVRYGVAPEPFERKVHLRGGIAMEWKTPEFEEIEIRAEVTAYAGTWPEWD